MPSVTKCRTISPRSYPRTAPTTPRMCHVYDIIITPFTHKTIRGYCPLKNKRFSRDTLSFLRVNPPTPSKRSGERAAVIYRVYTLFIRENLDRYNVIPPVIRLFFIAIAGTHPATRVFLLFHAIRGRSSVPLFVFRNLVFGS